jgi:fumarate reductase flavoprotein subunit
MHIKSLILKSVIAVYGTVGLFSLGYAQTQGFLADRHAARNIACSSCHGAGEPTLTSMKASCLACHGSYAELAQRTSGGPVNPHQSHLGEPYCSFCHRGHEKSVNGCAGGKAGYCHGSSVLFQFDVP